MHRRLGGGLIVSAAVAVLALIVVSVVMAEDYLRSDQLVRWRYTTSWINGVLGFYAWTAFWLGLKLRLTTRDRFAHILVLVVLAAGVLMFVLSCYSEITD